MYSLTVFLLARRVLLLDMSSLNEVIYFEEIFRSFYITKDTFYCVGQMIITCLKKKI